MRKTIALTSMLLLVIFVKTGLSQNRIEIPLNDNWQFSGGSVTGEAVNETINIPHTWNAKDAQEGIPYFRGNGTYQKGFVADASWKGKRVFVRFEGVMTIAKVYLNGAMLGEHRGGYAAFIFELTDKLVFDQENILKVVANNEFTLDVLPLFGDFNIYGGMYRPVSLIVTSPVCISPLDFASPGIYLKQSNVSDKSAELDVEIKLSSSSNQVEKVTVSTKINDANGNLVAERKNDIRVQMGESTVSERFNFINPKLWNGKKDAYLYSVKIELLQNGVVIDSKKEPLGFRNFRVDPNEGFFLNGKHVALQGVSRHQDRKEKGNALSYSDHKEDMEMMLEMGINALRLAHYQHSETIYDLCDSAGLVVWAEMPWVGGPGGFIGESNGYEPTEAFHSNAKQQLQELIRQNFNHPSICFWSIFNEIQNPEDESPVQFINELNNLAKAEDPSRLTVGASMLDPKENIHNITDAIAWNRYFGWYYDMPEKMGEFLDETHKTYPNLCIGISEYGAGASIAQHTQKLKRPNPFGSPHPEEWQSYYHEQHLKIYNERPYVWGTFLWNMFDFGSQFRREGDHYGINDKGLVTFDRKTRKDAFYFFKANWSEEPVLFITSKKYIFRDEAKTDIKVYSNLKSLELWVNGESVGTRTPENCIAIWESIELKKGNNGIKVDGELDGKTLSDQCVFVLDNGFGTKQIAKIYNLLQYDTIALFIGLLLIVWMWFVAWWRKERTPKWKRIVAKIFFFALLFATIALIVLKILVSKVLG